MCMERVNVCSVCRRRRFVACAVQPRLHTGHCVVFAAAVDCAHQRRRSRKQGPQETSKASHDLLEPSASAAESSLSALAVPGASGTSGIGHVAWTHTNSGIDSHAPRSLTYVILVYRYIANRTVTSSVCHYSLSIQEIVTSAGTIFQRG